MINLGILRHSHSVWISDYTGYEKSGQPYDADTHRAIRSGANTFLPAASVQQSLYLPYEATVSHEKSGMHNYLSHFAGHFGLGQGLVTYGDADLEQMAGYSELHKRVRHHLAGDYHDLFPQPETRDCWDGWQFSKPESGTGMVAVFRLAQSTRSDGSVCLKGLPDGAQVGFRLVAGDADVSADGPKLRITFKQERALLLEYAVEPNSPVGKGVISDGTGSPST
jgi:hypothetical protein